MDLIKAGQKLNISFIKEEKLVEIAAHVTKVLDDRMAVELPQYFMRYIEYLDVGKCLTVKVFSKIGTIDFNTVIISSPLEDDFWLELDLNSIKLTPNEEIAVIDAVEKMSIKRNNETVRVETFQISTNFIKFYSDTAFKIEDKIECDLNLSDKCGIINFTGIVSDIDPVYDNEFTVTFSTMTEDNRQNLLYFLYLYSNNETNRS